MATPSLPCANHRPYGTSCQNAGTSGCIHCRLVVYCSSKCQEAHWPFHEAHCTSPMNSDKWKPAWVLEKRTPSFIRAVNDPSPAPVRGTSCLWGGVPALDILKLDTNEGESYEAKLSLLFAASGDMRNVVKTIAELPPGWDQPIDITMNDADLAVVARNAIILFIAFSAEDESEAIDCIIHMWYSSLIRESDRAILKQRIRPKIQAVTDQIKGLPANMLFKKDWSRGKLSLRLSLTKAAWDKLLSYATVPEGLTMERANRIRNAVTLAESRIDYLERQYLFTIPSHRVPKKRFREDGILRPFGAQGSEFSIPNPTFFQSPFHWPMLDWSDPLYGWSMKEVDETENGPATFDIYGKLLTYLRSVLRTFMSHMKNTEISLKLLNVEATELTSQLEWGSFDRIEVSNICDNIHLGTRRTVLHMAPLLRSSADNPHATLITLFQTTISNEMTKEDRDDLLMGGRAYNEAFAVLSDNHPMGPLNTEWDGLVVQAMHASAWFRTFDHIYDKITPKPKLHDYPVEFNVEIKDQNTIIEKLPFRLKRRVGQEDAKQELLCMMV
ncbi:hypothetical protein H9Q73_013382 [Fusarium xylarioides]|nr:hypothetical protein H9Q73_013382 [Fusarium xylarioides]